MTRAPVDPSRAARRRRAPVASALLACALATSCASLGDGGGIATGGTERAAACAAQAHLEDGAAARVRERRCLSRLVRDLDLRRRLAPGPTGPVVVALDDVPGSVQVDRRLSPARAPNVVDDARGLPVVVAGRPAEGDPWRAVLPAEGVFRAAVLYVEATPSGPVLRVSTRMRASAGWPLALDPASGYLELDRRTRGTLPAVRDMLRGPLGRDAVRIRAIGEPSSSRMPVLLIHGLASSPRTWRPLAIALLRDRCVGDHVQLWSVHYATHAPLLVNRRLIAREMERVRATYRAAEKDVPDTGLFVVGHSMGGVLARLLGTSSAGGELWNVAFRDWAPALQADPGDLRDVIDLFVFEPVDGVRDVVAIASPHRGAPLAANWLGRTVRALQPRRSDELAALRRISRSNPDAMDPALRQSYLRDVLGSIATLSPEQPVSRAAAALPVDGSVRLHVVAGIGRRTAGGDGDGVVPRPSADHPQAASRRFIRAGHDVHRSDEAIAHVIGLVRTRLGELGRLDAAACASVDPRSARSPARDGGLHDGPA